MPVFATLPLRFERTSAALKFRPAGQWTNVDVYPVRVITEIRVYVEGVTPQPVDRRLPLSRSSSKTHLLFVRVFCSG